MKRLLLLIPALLLAACGDDDPAAPPPPAPQKFENLSQKWHVLNNLELAYNRRRADRYEELLDAEFAFHLTPGGPAVPSSWKRTDEIALHERMFDPDLDDPNAPPCRSIDMDVLFDDVVWLASPSPAAPAGGSTLDSLYTTTVFYDFTMQLEPNDTYLAVPGAKIQVIVRNVGTEPAPAWRLVEMRDLGAIGTPAVRSASSVDESYLSHMKALYLPPPEYSARAEKNDVLADLELAYNWRHVGAIEDILEPNFTFHLWAGDVGGSIPAQWDRADEVLQTSRLFDRSLQGSSFPRCTALVADLAFDDTLPWIGVIPSSAPGEEWYQATVDYELTVTVLPGVIYRSLAGARAQFFVRNTGTEESPQWSLVEWRDLGSPGATTSAPAGLAIAEATWGGVKALYR